METHKSEDHGEAKIGGAVLNVACSKETHEDSKGKESTNLTKHTYTMEKTSNVDAQGGKDKNRTRQHATQQELEGDARATLANEDKWKDTLDDDDLCVGYFVPASPISEETGR